MRNETGEKDKMTYISAHSGPRRKLVTLTEWGALLQVRRADQLHQRDSFIFEKPESRKRLIDGAGEGT
ncbi:MAG: hypothetical protein ABR607_08795 [Pyrinomonadaceae bacterium]